MNEHVAGSGLDLSLQIKSHSFSLDTVTCSGGESSCGRNFFLHGSNSGGSKQSWGPVASQGFFYQPPSQQAHRDDLCKRGPLEAKILHYSRYSLSPHPRTAGVGLEKAHRNL